MYTTYKKLDHNLALVRVEGKHYLSRGQGLDEAFDLFLGSVLASSSYILQALLTTECCIFLCS